MAYYGGGGFRGGMNMNALMQQAQKMQEQMQKAQEELEQAEIVGSRFVTGGLTRVLNLMLATSNKGCARCGT